MLSGRSDRLRTRGGSGPWVLTLAALTGVTALSIDMSLPAQPAIARDFGVDSDVAQLTLSLFLAGFATSQIVFGVLSDAFGRRPVLLAGLTLFSLAGMACALSASIGVLLTARFVQGVGASAAPVVARAMVRDTQSTAAAARTLSTIMAVLAVAPMVAPLLGASLLEHFGWHAIFTALAGFGVVLILLAALTLAETLPVARRSRLSFASVRAGVARFFQTPGTKVPTALICLGFIGQFSFISNSPFILIDGYGISPRQYGLYFGATAVALMAGSMIGRSLLARWKPPRVLMLGAAALCAGGLLVLVGVSDRAFGAPGLIAPMIVYCLGVGLIVPSAAALAMEPVADMAGFASAIIGSLQMLSGAIAGYLTSRIGDREPRTLGAVLALAGIAATLLATRRLMRER